MARGAGAGVSALDLPKARHALACAEALVAAMLDAGMGGVEAASDVREAIRRDVAYAEAVLVPIAKGDAVAVCDGGMGRRGARYTRELVSVGPRWVTLARGVLRGDRYDRTHGGHERGMGSRIAPADLERIRRCFPRGAK